MASANANITIGFDEETKACIERFAASFASLRDDDVSPVEEFEYSDNFPTERLGWEPRKVYTEVFKHVLNE